MATKNNKEESNVTGLKVFQKKLESKASMLKRIEEIKAGETRLFPIINKMREEIDSIRGKLNVYLQGLKKRMSIKDAFDENSLAAHEQKDLAEFRNQLVDLEEALSADEATMEKLGDEKNALQKTLSELHAEITEIDVLEYQQKVAAARKSVEDIMVIIENQTTQIEAARSAPSLLADLTERKEDILAEIALGKNLQKELDKITSDIETEKKLLATREKTISEAGKSLPGLQRKLSAAKENLQNLENQKSEILIQYLRHEAEQIGQEYSEAALNLIDKYNRLISIDALIIVQGGKAISGGGFHDFSIPAFHLSALSSLVSQRMPQELVTARMACTRENKDSAITREKKRISDLGIEL